MTTTIIGIDKPEVLDKALAVAQGFQPMQAAAMQSLRDRCRRYAADGRFELFKLSLRFDNPEARLAHRFPLDMQQVEVREMLKMADNSGHPTRRRSNMPHGFDVSRRTFVEAFMEPQSRSPGQSRKYPSDRWDTTRSGSFGTGNWRIPSRLANSDAEATQIVNEALDAGVNSLTRLGYHGGVRNAWVALKGNGIGQWS